MQRKPPVRSTVRGRDCRAFRHGYRGELEYLVIWKVPASDATWEPAANLADLDRIVRFQPACQQLSAQRGSIRPTVRSAGELNNACRRCRCLGCGARRLVKKADTKRHLMQQEDRLGTHSSSTSAKPVASGYSGASSWPVELLGPKPHPPYIGNIPAAAASNVAPVPQLRNIQRVLADCDVTAMTPIPGFQRKSQKTAVLKWVP